MLSTFTSPKYRGIMYMLVAALGFSLMGGFAKVLRNSFNAPQLVFYRNLTGLIVLSYSFFYYPIQQSGGRMRLPPELENSKPTSLLPWRVTR